MTGQLDTLMARIGTGRWNMLYYCTVGALYLVVPMHVLAGSFLAPTLDYECVHPYRSGPRHQTNTTEGACSLYNATTGEDMLCREWIYDNSNYVNTVTSEFDLVCGHSYLSATFQSIYMFGNFIGSFVSGFTSDMYGRRPTVLVGSVIVSIFSVVPVWLSSFGSIFACRFLVGLAMPTFTQVVYAFALEVCEAPHRAKVGIIIAFPWAFGVMAWGGLGYYIRDWRHLQMAIALPSLFSFPLLWFLDESPRWLMVKGKTEELLKVLQKAARWNKVDPPTLADIQKAVQETEELEKVIAKAKRPSFAQRVKGAGRSTFVLCKTPRIRLVTLVMYFDYFVAAMVFYGLSLSGSSYTDDPYLYMVITGLMEAPGYCLTAPILDYFGRRKTISAGYIICGFAILSTIFVPARYRVLIMTLAMVGKLCISGTYQGLVLYSTELFPTQHPIYSWMPPLIFGGWSIVAGLATFFLHETLNTKLPDTVDEFESFRERSKEKELKLITVESERSSEAPDLRTPFRPSKSQDAKFFHLESR